MTRHSQFITGAIVFVLIEIALVAFVDRPLSEYLRAVDARHPAFIDIFRAYTDFGKSKWYLWPFGIGAIACAFLVRRDMLAEDMRVRMGGAGETLLFLFIGVAASGIVTDIIKPLLGRARPVELDRDGIYGFHPLSFHSVWNSMPSGHATTAFALACLLAPLFPRFRAPIIALAVLLAGSRIMVNAHYLSDVLAGGGVGCATVILLRRVFPNGISLVNRRIFPIDRKNPKP